MGGAALGQCPRFPAPEQYLPKYDEFIYGKRRPRLPTPVANQWVTSFPSHEQLIGVLDDLCALYAMVEGEAGTGKPLQEPKFTGFYTVPLLHRLFSLKLETPETPQERMIFEASKEAAFIFLQLLRHLIAQRYPCLKQPFIEFADAGRTSLLEISVRRLEKTMYGHSAVWTDMLPLKCWVLKMSVSASLSTQEDPPHLCDLLYLAGDLDYNASCQSMGILMNNLVTDRFDV